MPDSIENQGVEPAFLLGIAEPLSVNPFQQINLTSTVFRVGCFVFYDLGFFSSLRGLTRQALTGCITSAGMPSVA